MLFTTTSLKSQDSIRIRFQDDPSKSDFGCTQVVFSQEYSQRLRDISWTKDLYRELLSVYVAQEAPKDTSTPPVLGSYEIQDGALIFRPRFIPPPDIHYTIIFNTRKFGKLLGREVAEISPLVKTVQLPTLETQSLAYVIGISPPTSHVPANLLRVYIHFSAPMGDHNPYQYLSLFDDTGNKITDPFVEIPQGLWDANRKRLTVFLHPGRIKRGVGPNVKSGPIMEEGHSYKLVLSKKLKDTNGVPMTSTFEHTFRATAPDREK
ncbi:MAG: hypothetical protein KI790_04720 [Cyclobacteriaceae bacterium]|nr:hypothetical protein [Cyclobacteriaceae bacterium HetDA_MAG_MS6]